MELQWCCRGREAGSDHSSSERWVLGSEERRQERLRGEEMSEGVTRGEQEAGERGGERGRGHT